MNRYDKPVLSELSKRAEEELIKNILPFWMNRMPDNENDGFFGRINGENKVISDAPKGAILNARILWTFSAAFRALGHSRYLKIASRAMDYILCNFFDEENGGTYWILNCDGTPLDTKKQIYSQAFFIYALSEYFMASSDEKAKVKAIELFNLVEEHSFDKEMNGYLEAFDRRWGELADLRLSAKDANEKKTMNTHLHVLEAYTNLYRIWPDKHLGSQLKNLVEIFLEKIIDKGTSHLNLFFDENWQCKSTIISYGHDIEASWLLFEAAGVLDDKVLIKRVKEASVRVVRAAMEGSQHDGSLIYERDNAVGHLDMDRHWWVQAEAVVGFLYAYKFTGDESFLNMSVKCFDYIRKYLVDPKNGEWYWSIRADGSVNIADDKAGFWKCPYHNSRMCLEIMASSI
jgi:mannobiose 2-epimerase